MQSVLGRWRAPLRVHHTFPRRTGACGPGAGRLYTGRSDSPRRLSIMAGRNRTTLDPIRPLLARARAEGEADLLRRFVAARDEEAFAELLRRHGPMVLGLCRRVADDF